MSHTPASFESFLLLPSELQRLVWVHCLPLKRAIENEFPFPPKETYNDEGRSIKDISIKNLKTPVIAHVCHLARIVTRENQHPHDVATQGPDAILAPWRSKDSEAVLTNARRDAWIPYTHRTREDLDRWAQQPNIKSIAAIRGVFLEDFYACLMFNNEEVMKKISRNGDGNGKGKVLQLIFAHVTIHAHNRDAAVRSGLFGRLGEEPIQILDLSDEVRCDKFRRFYDVECQHGSDFIGEGVLSSATDDRQELCREMKEHAEQQWMLQSLFRHPPLEIPGVETPTRTPTSWESLCNGQWGKWKMEIPWVKLVLDSMPKFKPIVVVRLFSPDI